MLMVKSYMSVTDLLKKQLRVMSVEHSGVRTIQKFRTFGKVAKVVRRTNVTTLAKILLSLRIPEFQTSVYTKLEKTRAFENFTPMFRANFAESL